ncbi:redox-sensitive transcriptional activator SoxR [Vannielia litorea]|uniref:MerR family transcriptional regulator, redox-sensitive transcriptional activator SoxR n=1 Tax=Vannielia litorea TaxID=1217970 RepID=A0A1N6GS56_9RHOB|nr:redox-sensitive transcriptional activator SoxR [Vannielia litorea]SIO10394.1 MerR family transcriptional regulator, redox-sensitive transcriptional activator SoxR [Vannielia litorea]
MAGSNARLRANDVLSIGQFAARAGLAVSALRFYEAEGLIAPMRAPSGQRRFRRADIRRVSFVRIAQQFGYTLPQIKAMLAGLPEGRTPTAKDWRKISERFREGLDQRIAALKKMRDDLDGCIGCGCLSLEKCALYNREDKAASRGAGPRYLMGDRSDEIGEVGG